MNTKQFAFATIAGGVTLFVLGFLLWGLAFAGFFESNLAMAGVMKDPPDFLWLGLSTLITGAFLAYVFGTWASISTAITGLKAGAVIGLFVGFGYGLGLYGTANMMNLIAHIVDAVLVGVWMGVGGAVIGAILGSGRTAAAA